MPLSKPVRLDPFQRIVNVGWGGGDSIILLQFGYRSATNTAPGRTPYQFAASFQAFPTGEIIGASVIDAVGPTIAPPGPSSQIKSNNNAWCFAPKKTEFIETDTADYTIIDRGLYQVQTNIGLIEELIDPLFGTIVPFYIDFTGNLGGGGGLDVLDGTSSAAINSRMEEVFNLASPESKAHLHTLYPHLVAVISSHVEYGAPITYTERKADTATFLNVNRIKSQASLGNLFGFKIFCFGTDGREFLSWNAALATWKNQGDWSLDTSGDNYFVNNTVAPIDFAEVSNPPNSEIATPPQLVEFEVDLATMRITKAAKVRCLTPAPRSAAMVGAVINAADLSQRRRLGHRQGRAPDLDSRPTAMSSTSTAGSGTSRTIRPRRLALIISASAAMR